MTTPDPSSITRAAKRSATSTSDGGAALLASRCHGSTVPAITRRRRGIRSLTSLALASLLALLYQLVRSLSPSLPPSPTMDQEYDAIVLGTGLKVSGESETAASDLLSPVQLTSSALRTPRCCLFALGMHHQRTAVDRGKEGAAHGSQPVLRSANALPASQGGCSAFDRCTCHHACCFSLTYRSCLMMCRW